MPSGGGCGGDQDGRWRCVDGGMMERVEGPPRYHNGARMVLVAISFTKNQRGETQSNKSC
jgi:hypothetical protein